MEWKDIRRIYPGQWLVIEALEAHTMDNRRILDRISVIDTCMDGAAAFQSYQKWHRQYPLREFYFVHTNRATLEIRERTWVGIRRAHKASLERISSIHRVGFKLSRPTDRSIIRTH